MAAYLDASALAKLVLAEAESESLRASLGSTPEMVSSELVRTELPRAIRRAAAGRSAAQQALLAEAAERLARVALVAITTKLLDAAGELAEPRLRALDAIHVATALSLGPGIDVFLTYDRRQLYAAEREGLYVASPGG